MLDQEFNQNPFCLWKPPPEWLPLPGPASLCTDRCRLLIYDVIIKTFSLIQCDPSPLTGGHQMAWSQQASFLLKMITSHELQSKDASEKSQNLVREREV